jgi:CheY-like chemotaxis protein
MKKTTRILIVEDDGIIATEMRQMLLSSGYEVTSVVASGKCAVKAAEKDPPDIVLMDIKLPGALDGIEVAKQIRASHDIPVIYLSAHSDKDLINRAKITEPQGYLLKPVQGNELRIAIEMALYKHQIEMKLKETNQRLEQEINERKRAEEELQQLKKAVETMHIGVTITDLNRKILYTNPAEAKMHGYQPEELVGKDVSILISAERRKRMSL